MKKFVLLLCMSLMACASKVSYPQVTEYTCGEYNVIHNIPTGTIVEDTITITTNDGVHELKAQRFLNINTVLGGFNVLTYAEPAIEAVSIFKNFNELIKDKCTHCGDVQSSSSGGYSKAPMSEKYLFVQFSDYIESTGTERSYSLFIDGTTEYSCTPKTSEL